MCIVDIKCLLAKNTNEITSIVRALRGEYIKPGVGGDLLRDVSCTAYKLCCNIHTNNKCILLYH
jgi:hypothetical protein